MLATLIRFAFNQRLLMIIAMLMLSGAGWHAYQNLAIDAFPDVSSTQVKIIVKAPGMTPEEVEARITSPIEVELLGIPKQTMLRSTSKYALADITLDFEDDADIYWARQQVAERLTAIWGDLPSDISGGLAPMTTPLGEMFMFTIDSETLSLTERRSLLDWVIRPALRTVPGVADVNALGGFVKTFEVIPINEKMYAQGVSLEQLSTALEDNNRNDGAGRLVEGEETLLVRSEGSLKTLEDVAGVVVKTDPIEPVRVKDVAEVKLGAITRYGSVTQNGKGEAVEGLVLGLRGANARLLVRGIEAKLAEISTTLPADATIHTFYNRGDLVDRAIHTVSKALIEAIILVFILLFIFLGDLRAAITVALVLPLSALGTFILMQYVGMSANLMSLGGLAIAIGMLVDGAVVVIENMVSHLAHPQQDRTPLSAVLYHSVVEVATPVTTGILIIMVVFLPLLSLQGLEGKLFSPVAVTIMFALGISLVLSLTIIPVVGSLMLNAASHQEPKIVQLLNKGYLHVLNFALKHAQIIFTVAIALLVLTVAIYNQIGKTFMPTLDEGNIIVQLEKLPSISLEDSLRTDLQVQQVLRKKIPEIIGITARTGSDEIGLDPMGLNQTDTFMELKPTREWRMPTKNALIEEIRQVIEEFPGLVYAFTQPIEMRVSEMIIGVRGDVAIRIFGADLDVLNHKAEEIASVVREISGAEDVYAARNAGVQYLSIKIDQLAIGRLGVSVNQVVHALRSLVEGQRLGTIYEGIRRTPLIIRGQQNLRTSPSEFASLMLTLPNGRNVPISTLAKLQRVEGPVMINRERGARTAVVIANVAGRDLVGFVEEAKAKVQELVKLDNGYTLQWGGQFENQQRAAKRLSIVIPIAIGLVFLLLYTTFNSVKQALLVLVNIPFAMVGGVIALWLAHEYLSVPASVGFIALLGIAVLNGVVMVSYFNQLYVLGMDLSKVVIEGAQRRLRPVIMTASITALGLLPLLFATGPGSEIQRPLAIVVIGGLVSSTGLTLILLPVLYRRYGVAEQRD